MSIVLPTMGFFVRLRTLGACALLAWLSLSRTAAAAGPELTDAEVARLTSGQPVVREDTVERNGRRYIGGVGYVLIDAAPDQIARVLFDPATYGQILPRTRSTRLIGFSREGDEVVELTQGNSLVHGTYTVRVRRDHPPQGQSWQVVRFWLDPRFSHDIVDGNGYFRMEPMGDRTLLTYVVMVDVGSGLFSRMFEGKIRALALSTPQLVKNYVESHSQG